MSRIQAHCDRIDDELDLLIDEHWTEANEYATIMDLRIDLEKLIEAFKQTKPEEFDKE